MLETISIEENIMIEAVMKAHSLKDVIRASIAQSGLSYEFIANSLKIDKGHFSRIFSSDIHNFPANKLVPFMELVGNYLPLMWIARRCGKDLVDLSESHEEENIKLKHEISELKKELMITKDNLKTIGVKIQELN